MKTLPLIGLHAIYAPTIFLLTFLVYLPLLPFFLLGYLIFNKGRRRLDDAMRVQACLYGRFVLAVSRPIIRVRRVGIELVPRDEPCVLVSNHRSHFDIFICSQQPLADTNVVVRAWPLRMFFIGWFMRRAGYMDIESEPMEDILERARHLTRRGVSILFFPEGHRSRDGRLQRFRSGAFLVATDNNLPIVPVVITGTERMAPFGTWLPRPATVHLEVLPPVRPESFPEEKRALRLRRHVENLFREHLGEELVPEGDAE